MKMPSGIEFGPGSQVNYRMLIATVSVMTCEPIAWMPSIRLLRPI